MSRSLDDSKRTPAEVVRDQLDYLETATIALESIAARVKAYARDRREQLALGRPAGELPLPLCASDLAAQAGLVVRHVGKVDLAIELAYYAAERERAS